MFRAGALSLAGDPPQHAALPPQAKAGPQREAGSGDRSHVASAPNPQVKKIAGKLREQGFAVNKKQVQRVRREEGMQVPPPKPRIRRRGLTTGLPQQAGHRNHVWAWDFVSDYTQRGGALRTFNLVDEYTRECHCIHADRRIRATDVLALLQEVIEQHGAPEYIRSDNGPEFIAKAIQKRLRRTRSRRSISIRAARGRTATWRASIAGFGPSV